MTEERIKELLILVDGDVEAVMEIIRTVAAEAREEGTGITQELVTAAKEMVELIENTDYDSSGYYDDGPNNDDMNRWHGAVFDALERLKEKER